MKKLIPVFLFLFSQLVSANPITLIVPYPAGGPADTLARSIQQLLSDELDRSVMIEYKPGAGTAIGTAHVANSTSSKPILLLNTVGALVNPILKSSPEYDPDQLVALNYLGRTPLIFVTSNKSGIKSFLDWQMLDANKSITFATSGQNSATGLTTDYFKKLSGKNIVPVPYKGAGQSIIDLLSGNVDAGFFYYSQVDLLTENGQTNLIAVEWDRRLNKIESVPTFKEKGIADVGNNNWWILFINRSSSLTDQTQIQKAMVKILKNKELVNQIKNSGVEIVPGQLIPPPNFIRTESKRITESLK